MSLFKLSFLAAAPEAPPGNIRCTIFSAKDLEIRWDSIPRAFTNGKIAGYKLSYRRLNGFTPEDARLLEIDVHPAKIYVHIQSLAPFAKYSFTLAAYTAAGEGPKGSVDCATYSSGKNTV